MFRWDDSLITGEDRENIESIVVEINDISARHRLDIVMNTQFSLIDAKERQDCFTQSLPVSINLKR